MDREKKRELFSASPGIASAINYSTSGDWLFPAHYHHWSANNPSPTALNFNILETKNLLYLWVYQNQLCSGASEGNSPCALFTITTVNQDDPSYITIGSKCFTDTHIVAADFSAADWPSLIITSPKTPSNSTNVIGVFQRSLTRGSETISVTHPSLGTVYYWDINSDDWPIVLSLEPSGVFVFSECLNQE